MSADFSFKLASAFIAIVLSLVIATAEFRKEHNKRLRWILAVVAASLSGIVALGLLTVERAQQLEEAHQQARETQLANRRRDSLNVQMRENLHRLDLLRTNGDTTSLRLQAVMGHAQQLEGELAQVGANIRSIAEASARIRGILAVQESLVTKQSRRIQQSERNSERLLSPLDQLGVSMIVEFPLLGPLATHFERMRKHLDSLRVQVGADSFFQSARKLDLVEVEGYDSIKAVSLLDGSPWFPDSRDPSQRDAARLVGQVDAEVQIFHEPRDAVWNVNPDVIFNFQSAWPETHGPLFRANALVADPRSQRKMFIVDFEKKVIYVTFIVVGHRVWTDGRIHGLVDLAGSALILEFAPPTDAIINRSRVSTFQLFVGPDLSRRINIHLERLRDHFSCKCIAYEFTPSEVQTLTGEQSRDR